MQDLVYRLVMISEEQFQLAMLRVPRCLEKIDCSLFCVEFPQLIDELNAKMELLIKTSDAIVKCDPLVNVLKKVLKEMSFCSKL